MHLIHKHKLDFGCRSKELGYQIKNDISPLLEHDLYPKLDALLQTYDSRDDIWLIDKIPIQINISDLKNWKAEFIRKCIHEIESFINENAPTSISKFTTETSTIDNSAIANKHLNVEQNKIKTKTVQQQYNELFIYYLNTGVIQNNAVTHNLGNVFSNIELQRESIAKIELTLSDDFNAILRWTLNVPKKMKLKYLELQRIMHNLDFSEENSKQSSKMNQFLEFLYWIGLFKIEKTALKEPRLIQIRRLAKSYFNIEEEYIDRILYVDSIEENNGTQDDSKNIVQENTKEQTLFFILNSGLILLHPFVFHLFHGLGFLDNKKWKSKETQHRAVLILQYLVNSDSEFFENELQLNKLLCGVPLNEAVATEWEITSNEKKQCAALLETVISHWTALKNTSIATLQESFIKRAGKLSLNRKHNYEMNVEQKSIDILLDKLPWGIGMIKTPWMEEHLICNWI